MGHNTAAEQIKERVTVPAALRLYGYAEGGRRIPCPIHNGKDRNFSFTDKVFRCWSCGASGDVIRLIEALFGLSFREAVAKLNNDFGLGIANAKPDYRTQKKLRLEARANRSMKEMYEERRRECLMLCKLHAVLYRQHLREPDNAGLKKYVENLEDFLDVLTWRPEN
jgi:DNA primase